MKAVFKNIGPISKAEFDLKDLTIIAGANNTGKTYLAYTLYGFLKSLKPLVHYSIDHNSQRLYDQGIQQSDNVEPEFFW
ncbi:AAA family ATPase [Desulfobacterales bacterium HSG16]|nr:AAA family ATPase [Desulfobacterales bacterium HSG16]